MSARSGASARSSHAPRPQGPADLLRPAADAVRAWFFSDSWSAALAWMALACALAAVLVWFFVLSPYGAPAAPAYAEF